MLSLRVPDKEEIEIGSFPSSTSSSSSSFLSPSLIESTTTNATTIDNTAGGSSNATASSSTGSSVMEGRYHCLRLNLTLPGSMAMDIVSVITLRVAEAPSAKTKSSLQTLGHGE